MTVSGRCSKPEWLDDGEDLDGPALPGGLETHATRQWPSLTGCAAPSGQDQTGNENTKREKLGGQIQSSSVR